MSSTTGLDALSFSPTNGAISPHIFEFDLTGSTQYTGASQVRENKQDGNSAGLPVGFNIDHNGVLNVYYNNGESKVAGRIALAEFQSPQNLARSANMSWLSTSESGNPIITPSTSEGTINTGTVELSNVDLTEELVRLLGAQHDFQANAQVEQTYNQVLQTIENL